MRVIAILLALVATPVSVAYADEAEPVTPAESLELDRSLQALKVQAAELEARLTEISTDYESGQSQRLSVLLLVDDPDLEVERISIEIDDAEVINHEYSARQYAAMRDRGAHRLLEHAVRSGNRRLRIVADVHRDGPGFGRAQRQVDETLTIDKRWHAQTLVLRIDRRSRWFGPRLKFELIDQPGAELQQREFRFVAKTTDSHGVIVRAADLRNAAQSTDELRSLLSEAQLASGLTRISLETLDNTGTPAGDEETRYQREYRLADSLYRRGYLVDAALLLLRMPEDLRQVDEEQRLSLLGRVLMAQGRYSEAAAELEQISSLGRRDVFYRYNLAIAMLQSGRVDDGVTLLDEVGRASARSAIDRELRDRANVLLGYTFLRTGQAATARPVLKRVSADGRYAERALLALGWSELTDAGHRQHRSNVSTEEADNPLARIAASGILIRPPRQGDTAADRMRRSGFRREDSDEDQQSRRDSLERALVSWLTIEDGNPGHLDVIEARLAIGYALTEAGSDAAAAKRYLATINEIERELAYVATVRQQADSGRLIDRLTAHDANAAPADWVPPNALPDLPEAIPLAGILASNNFQNGLRNYRDARWWSSRLGAQLQRLAEIQSNLRRAETASTASAVVEQRLAGAAPLFADHPITLRIDRAFKAGLTQRPEQRRPYGGPGLSLRLSGSPARFSGFRERHASAYADVLRLQPWIRAFETEQRYRLLQDVRTHLREREELLTVYLAGARFALARIYDRQAASQ